MDQDPIDPVDVDPLEMEQQQRMADGVARKLSFAEKMAALKSKASTTPPNSALSLVDGSTAPGSKEPSANDSATPPTIG